MCGFTGFWSSQTVNNGDAILKEMTSALHHRGPDGYGYHCNPERGLFMGHARLSINDLATGDQPIRVPGLPTVFTGNGEFYEFKERRAFLVAEGCRFATKSDNELALHYYAKLGLGFVHELRGEFAFALYDESQNRLILARDRFGIRPLFYAVRGDTFLWGSEMKAMFQHPNIRPEIDKRVALHQMMQTMVPGDTLYQGVHAVKPGHILVVEMNGTKPVVKDITYWDLDFPKTDEYDMQSDPNGWIRLVRSSLIDAVKVRLEADVPVGAYLSGGIDSCSILGIASAMRQGPVKSFTIGFSDDRFDETHIARQMAADINSEQILLTLSHDQLYGPAYTRAMWHSERTFYNTLGVAKLCLSKTVHEHGIKVVVTGEGSDEIFGGYPFFKADMLQFGGPEMNTAAMNPSDGMFQGSILPEITRNHPAFDEICGFTPTWIQNWMSTLELARPLLSDDVRDLLADYDPVAAIAQSIDVQRIEGRHPLDICQYTWMKTMLEGQILNWGGDRVDMAFSVESRPPFLDHHLVELATRIPPTLRIRGGVEKWVLREAMKGVLPEVLYKRAKFPFMAPPSSAADREIPGLAKLTKTYLNNDVVKEVGVVSPEKLKEFLQVLQSNADTDTKFRCYGLLNHLIGIHYLHGAFQTAKPPPI